MVEIGEALTRTRELMSTFDRLTEPPGGWDSVTYPAAASIEAMGDVRELVAALQSIAPVIGAAVVTGRFGRLELDLGVSPSGVVSVVRTSAGDLTESFGVRFIDAARDAWNGDVDAAMGLPGVWSARATVQPAALLRGADPTMDWYLVTDASEVEQFLRSVPFWRSRNLFKESMPTVFVLREAPEDSFLSTPAIRVCSIATDASIVRGGLRGLDVRKPVSVLLEDSLLPEDLCPDDEFSVDLSSVALTLFRIAAGIAWAELATALSIRADESEMRAEYFGLQRVSHSLPADGPPIDLEACRRSVEILQWAQGANSSDRLIALRQVASLRTTDAPWSRPEDIRRAAEPIFLALRSDAVAEAIRAHREARDAAVSAARRTAELTAGLARGAVDRCLASLLAVGGVLVARSTSTLTHDQAAALRLLIAAVLVGLAVWSIVIERPPIFTVVRDYRADLSQFSDLITPEERERILGLQALQSARRQAILTSFAVPSLYASAAVAAIYAHL